MKKVRDIKALLAVFIFLCGLKEFVNAALIRNALTVSMHVLEVKEGWHNIILAATMLAVSLCIFPIIEHLTQMQKTKLRQYYQKKTSQEVLDKYHKMEFRYFDFVETYNLCNRTTKVAAEKMYQSNIVWYELMQNMIVVISLSYLIIQIAWWTFPFSIATVLPMIFVNRRKAKDMQDAIEKSAYYDRKAGYASYLLLNKESLMETKVFRSQPYIRNLWSENLSESVKRKRAIAFHAGKQGAIVNMIYAWAVAPVVYFVLWQVTKGKITFADYMVLSNAMSILGLTLVYGVATKFGDIRAGKLFRKDYQTIMDFNECRCSEESCMDTFEELRFEHVSFTYPGTSKKILSDLSFCLLKGEKLAIAGVNGAGKSTMIKLILGLYEPDHGKVTMNGVEVSRIPADIRRKMVTAVFQDYTKYEMTIRENFVRYKFTLRENIAISNISKLQNTILLKEHMAKYQLESIIEELPQGIDTILGREFGEVELSGGQWQKISIARGGLKECELIILDEPTASIDPVTESEIFHRFQQFTKNCCSIIISHRIGAARIANRILVLDHGKLVEDGSHQDLITKNGIYQRLYQMQAQWYS